MKTLDPTHQGTPPPVSDPSAETPRSRVGRRLLDLDGQPVRLPSDAFCGREAITHGEWLRRHALTYGERGAAQVGPVLLLLALTACALFVALLLSGAVDGLLGEGMAR